MKIEFGGLTEKRIEEFNGGKGAINLKSIDKNDVFVGKIGAGFVRRYAQTYGHERNYHHSVRKGKGDLRRRNGNARCRQLPFLSARQFSHAYEYRRGRSCFRRRRSPSDIIRLFVA